MFVVGEQVLPARTDTQEASRVPGGPSRWQLAICFETDSPPLHVLLGDGMSFLRRHRLGPSQSALRLEGSILES